MGLLAQVESSWGWIRRRVREEYYYDFYRLHMVYYVVTTLFVACIVYAMEDMPFIDAWFTTTSAMTVTGLSSINFANTSRTTKSLIAILICLGGQVAFAIVPLVLRTYEFWWHNRATKRGFRDIVPCIFLQKTNQKRSHTKTGAIETLSCISVLVKIYLVYGLAFTFLGYFSLWAYCSTNSVAQAKLADRGYEPWEFAFFTSISAFNNAGFSILSDSLELFQDDVFVVLIVCALMSFGNLLLPITMRWVVAAKLRWADQSFRAAAKGNATTKMKERRWKQHSKYKAILARPRTLTTHIFSSSQTYLLLAVFLVTTTSQFLLYTFLPTTGFQGVDLGTKALQMFFTTVATRTAGFNVIDIELLGPGLLLLQLWLMYLACYPFIVSMKSTTHVRLPLKDCHDTTTSEVTTRTSLEKEHCSPRTQHVLLSRGNSPTENAKREIQNLLSNDLVWLALATWLISMIEPTITVSSLFRLIWEVFSAYGNVGLSLAPEFAIASFVSTVGGPAKAVIIAVMIIGRHRSLPGSLDSAVAPIYVPPACRFGQRSRFSSSIMTTDCFNNETLTYVAPGDQMLGISDNVSKYAQVESPQEVGPKSDVIKAFRSYSASRAISAAMPSSRRAQRLRHFLSSASEFKAAHAHTISGPPCPHKRIDEATFAPPTQPEAQEDHVLVPIKQPESASPSL